MEICWQQQAECGCSSSWEKDAVCRRDEQCGSLLLQDFWEESPSQAVYWVYLDIHIAMYSLTYEVCTHDMGVSTYSVTPTDYNSDELINIIGVALIADL